MSGDGPSDIDIAERYNPKPVEREISHALFGFGRYTVEVSEKGSSVWFVISWKPKWRRKLASVRVRYQHSDNHWHSYTNFQQIGLTGKLLDEIYWAWEKI